MTTMVRRPPTMPIHQTGTPCGAGRQSESFHPSPEGGRCPLTARQCKRPRIRFYPEKYVFSVVTTACRVRCDDRTFTKAQSMIWQEGETNRSV
jgi:hypothetical protein